MYARRSTSETGKISHLAVNVVRLIHSTWLVHSLREENRQQEISELVAAGKIPHGVEMDKHPEKSLDCRPCEFPLHPSNDSHLIATRRVNGASRGFYQREYFFMCLLQR